MNNVRGYSTGKIYSYDEKNHIGSGGVGSVYSIDRDLCIKIYKNYEAEHEQKILYMVANPPFNKMTAKDITNSFVWPIEAVYSLSGKFVGFTMKRIQEAVPLNFLTELRIQDYILEKYPWLNNFKKDKPEALKRRLIICYNIARVIEILHKTKQYVIVDIKAENIQLQPNGNVVLLDLDNLQITKKGKVLFHSKASTPDIAPPEGLKPKFKVSKKRILPSWDVFSFSVNVYMLLTGGHPFCGELKKNRNNENQIKDLTKKRYYPMGKSYKKFRMIPFYHKTLKLLPLDIKHLFEKTFQNRKRPDISEWSNVLHSEYNKIKNFGSVSLSITDITPVCYHPEKKKSSLNTQIHKIKANAISIIKSKAPSFPHLSIKLPSLKQFSLSKRVFIVIFLSLSLTALTISHTFTSFLNIPNSTIFTKTTSVIFTLFLSFIISLIYSSAKIFKHKKHKNAVIIILSILLCWWIIILPFISSNYINKSKGKEIINKSTPLPITEEKPTVANKLENTFKGRPSKEAQNRLNKKDYTQRLDLETGRNNTTSTATEVHTDSSLQPQQATTGKAENIHTDDDGFEYSDPYEDYWDTVNLKYQKSSWVTTTDPN